MIVDKANCCHLLLCQTCEAADPVSHRVFSTVHTVSHNRMTFFSTIHCFIIIWLV